MTTPYDALGQGLRDQFRMYATAVAGERALAVAAGLPPGSKLQWSRADQFKTTFLEEAQRAMIQFHQDYLGNAEEVMVHRGSARFVSTTLEIARIANDVARQTVRQATFGKDSPISALKASRMGAGAIGLLAQQRLANPSFRVKDSAGRIWDGEKLVETLARDYAYQIFIDHQFDQAVKDGATVVELEHPDQNHEYAGLSIDLTEDDWMTVRDKTFHINSNLTIGYVVPSES